MIGVIEAGVRYAETDLTTFLQISFSSSVCLGLELGLVLGYGKTRQNKKLISDVEDRERSYKSE